jgi:cobalt-zinc-cadmium efflux system outer membrane protein
MASPGKNARFGSRAATAWWTATLSLGLSSLALAPAGCVVHHYHHFVADDSQSAAGTLTPPAAPGFVPAASPPQGQGVSPVRLAAHAVGDATPPQKPAEKPKADAPKESETTLPPPRLLSPPGLTFDQTINAALLADPRIRAGLEAINQANADLLTSSLLPNPTLSADVQLLPLTRPFTVDRQGGPPQTDYQVSYPIDWFLFGKRAAAMASAAAGVRVSEADYADLVRTRVRDTAVAFYDVLEAKGLLDLARKDLENLRRVEAAVRKAREAGGRPQVELNRVSLEALKSEQTLREAEKTLAVAKAALRARLGRRDPDPVFDVTGNLDAPLTAQPLPVEEALALAERNRPDIRSLGLQVEKAGRDVRTEMTKAYPQVTPQAGYTHQFQQKAIGFPDADSWMMSVSLTLPLFDRNQGNIAKARSVFVQNSLNREAGLVDLRSEIVQVVQDFRTAYRNAGAVAERQVRLAREVRDSYEKAYSEIKGHSLLEYLDAERNYRDTYRTYVNNRANYWRALYKFNSALGKQVLQHDDSTQQPPARPHP